MSNTYQYPQNDIYYQHYLKYSYQRGLPVQSSWMLNAVTPLRCDTLFVMTFEELGIKTKHEKRYATICPFCSHERKAEHQKLPCLTVNDEVGNRWYKCNNCQKSGNLDLLEKYDEVWKQSRMPKVRPAVYSKEVMQFFATKQIDPKVAFEDGVYEVDGANGHKEVAFPYYYRNQLVNVMFRRLHYDKEKQSKVYQVAKKYGTLTCFWGLHAFTPDYRAVIITEGQTDRLTWLQCGYKNVLSIPMGASKGGVNSKKLEFLTDPYILNLIKDVERIYLVMDNDETGQQFKDILAEQIGKNKCWVVKFPPGYKDSNELYAGDVGKNLEPKGKSGIDDVFKFATPFPVRGIILLDDCKDYIYKLRTNGFEPGYKIQVASVDRLFTIKKQMLMILTGVSSHGKSTFLRWYNTELCRKNGNIKLGLYSPEMRPPEREYAKYQEVYAEQRISERAKNSMNDAMLEQSRNWVKQRFFLVNPERKNWENLTNDSNTTSKSLQNILAYMLQLKRMYGISGFVLDAWNKLEHEIPKHTSETTYISRQLDIILEFLEVNDMFCQLIAHPTKMQKTKGGNHEIPDLYDISGSKAFYEKADIGITIHRKKFANTHTKDDNGDDIWAIDPNAPSLIKCTKIKFDELGYEGETHMYMDKRNGDKFTKERPAYFTDEQEEELELDLPF